MSSFNEDTEQKILKAFSLLIATCRFKQSSFSDIINKSEILTKYLSGNDLDEKDYEELDKP